MFKLTVLQFGFINILVIFQRRINYILGEHLDEFVMAYLNNIIIYFNTEGEYKEHVKWVLRKFYKESIPVAIKKCEFYIKKTDFIKFIIELK